MRSATLLLLAASLAGSALAQQLPDTVWCQKQGTAGDGSCEKAGWNTYCCVLGEYEAQTFNWAMTPQGTSKDDVGRLGCGPAQQAGGQYVGRIYCGELGK